MDYKQHIKKLLKTNKETLFNTNKNKTSVALVDILEDEMTNFSYQKTHDITYLFDMFDILVTLLKDNQSLQIQLYDQFTYIHNIIKNLLHAKPNDLTKKSESRFKILQNLINKMENTMLRIYYDNPAEYDPNKEEYIYYIVFKLKYINFFNATCQKFPHIVNSVDKDGTPLVEKVLEKYLEALDLYLSKTNLGPLDDLIYYDKVIRTIMTSEKIKIDDYNRKLMLEKIKEFAKTQRFDDNRRKEKLSFFTNNIINTIMGIPEDRSIEFLSYKYEIHNKFKEAHNLEANHIYLQHSNIEGITIPRKIYTFDGEGAKELDDGISLIFEDGIYHLGVHIANPTKYIPTSSILMDEANRRTTSIYIGDYCIPLFPFKLSGDLISLNAGKKTYCMSFYFDIDARTGELINFDIKDEICEITQNLTYDYFNKCIDHGTKDAEFFYTLMHLCNLSEILKRVYSEDVIYREFHNDMQSTLSQSVIESIMIYTNYHIAKYFKEHDLPYIYRSHTLNEREIAQLSDLQERLRIREKTTQIIKDIEMIKNVFPRAYYTSQNAGHFGLGVDYYSHTTSPLRRLADNVAMMCIDKFVLNEYTEDDKLRATEKIDEVAEAINSKRASVDDYEIEYGKRKLKVN